MIQLPNNIKKESNLVIDSTTFDKLLQEQGVVKEKNAFDRDLIIEILSKHFNVKILSYRIVFDEINKTNPAVYITYEPETLQPTDTLSISEIKEQMDEDHYIHNIVSVNIYNIIDMNFDQFLDHLSILLTGTDILSDINYKMVGIDDDNILFKVSGNVDLIIENED